MEEKTKEMTMWREGNDPFWRGRRPGLDGVHSNLRCLCFLCVISCIYILFYKRMASKITE